MKILLVHQFFLEKDDPGGSRFNEMTRNWVEAGHEVMVLAGMVNYITGKVPKKYKGKRFYEEQYQPGLNVLRCKVTESYNANFLGRLWAYFSFVWYSVIGGVFKLKGEKYDIILVTSPPLFVGVTAWILSKVKRVPYLFEIRDLWPESAIDSGVISNKLIIKLSYWFESFIYDKAKKINVLTPAFRNKLLEIKEIPEDKIIFIPNASDFELSDKLLNEFDVDGFKKKIGLKGKFVITYVGAHGVANHLIQLIEAAELIDNKNIVFQLIGGGMQKEKLMQEVKERKLKNVIFRDPVPKSEVFKYILASDMGTSVLKKVDTFKTIYSNKTFDYMACKKPVLLCIDGISRELVENAACGIYAEPENPMDIAKKAELYALDKSRCIVEGENGYRYAKRNFDRKVLAEKYIQELQSLVS